jgi:importin-7
MDGNKVVEALRATLNPQTQKEAESYLDAVHKIINFAPTLLQIMTMNDMDVSVRQAAAIYLKNLIIRDWLEEEPIKPGQTPGFSIHEQDKQQIRSHIVDAIVEAPQPIRIQLRDAITTVIRQDYPGRWEDLPHKICLYLESSNQAHWAAALFILNLFVSSYEFKQSDDSSREPLFITLPMWMPLIKRRLGELLQESTLTADSALIQKLVLKVFKSLIEFSLPANQLSREEIGQWVQVMVHILRQPIPEELVQDMSDDEKELTPYWKAKKWCSYTLHRLFERYGSPGNVMKAYNEFAEFFLRTFSAPILEVFFALCDNYRNHVFVSKAVIRNIMNYLEDAVKHAFCWKLIKPHFAGLLRDVIFPLMCHTDEDEELFTEDPLTYIREMYDIFEEMSSPVSYTKSFLGSVAAKRKNVLKLVMDFALEILNSDNATPKAKDGALHMIGGVAPTLLKRKMYKTQVEHFLERVVIPIMSNAPEGYRRARAVWLLGQMAEAKFSRHQVLEEAVRAVYQRFLEDSALPVQVEAILSIIRLIEGHKEIVKPVLLPHIGPITVHLLKLVKATHNDEVANALRSFIDYYDEEIIPIAADLMREMLSAFDEFLTSSINESGSHSELTNGTAECNAVGDTPNTLANILTDERILTLNGLLQTIDIVLMNCMDHKDILVLLEQDIIRHVVVRVLEMHFEPLYDETLSIVDSLTRSFISPLMWQVFELLARTMNSYKELYFTDYSPALYNFLTVDKPALRSHPEALNIILGTLHRVLTTESSDEDEETHAAKLMEVLLLEHRECLDSRVVISGVLEVIISRLTKDITISELRTMCLQVVIAAIYCSPQEMINFLMQHPWPGQSEVPIFHRLLEMWIDDVDCFLGLHDRKLCILGLLALMTQPPDHRPLMLTSTDSPVAAKLLPSLVQLLDSQTKAYETKAKEENEEESENEEEESDEEVADGVTAGSTPSRTARHNPFKELESDEDDVDAEGEKYISYLANDDDSDDDDLEDLFDTTSALEGFSTHLDTDDCTIDEYITFMQTLEHIKSQDVKWYDQMIASLNEEQRKALEQVCLRAIRQNEQKMSKAIEQSGGYNFQQVIVPPTFNFTSDGSASNVFNAGARTHPDPGSQ